MTADVQILGGEAAMADMRRWADQVAPAVDKAAEPFAQTVADRVRSKVPVLTGTLVSSVEVTDASPGVEVSIGDGVAYAAWIEFGGSRGRPYAPEGRYLYPTVTDAADEFYGLAEDAAADSVGSFRWHHQQA